MGGATRYLVGYIVKMPDFEHFGEKHGIVKTNSESADQGRLFESTSGSPHTKYSLQSPYCAVQCWTVVMQLAWC